MLGHVGQNRAVADLEQLVVIRTAAGAETLGQGRLRSQSTAARNSHRGMNRPPGTGLVVGIG